MQPMRPTLLLIQKLAHCLSFIDLETGAELSRIRLKDFPHEMVVDAERGYAYVGHYGVETSGHTGEGGHEILVIDLEKRAWLRSIDCWPYRRLHGLQMDQRGRLYALSEMQATLLVIDNPATDPAPSSAIPVGGIKSHLMTLTRDGETAFCANLLSHTITRVAPHAPLQLPAAVSPGRKPEGLCLSADEKVLFVTNRISATITAIDTQSLHILRSGVTRGDANRVYLDRRGQLVLCNYAQSSLSIYSAETLRELAFLELAAQPIAMSLAPHGNIGYLSTSGDEVIAIDLDHCAIRRRYKTLREPDVSYVINAA